MGLFGAKDFKISSRSKLAGHAGGVSCVALRGDLVVSAGEEKHDVLVWDAASGRQLASLAGHGEQVKALAISPDGGKVASAADDNTVRVWDLSSFEEQLAVERDGSVSALAFHPDSSRIVLGAGEATISELDLGSGSEEKLLSIDPATVEDVFEDPPDTITCLAISPDGRFLAARESEGAALVWDLDEAKTATILVSPPFQYFTVAVSRDGRYLLGAGGKFSVSISLEVGGSAEVKISELGGFLRVEELTSDRSGMVSTGDFVCESAGFSSDGSRVLALASVPPTDGGVSKVLHSYAVDDVLGGGSRVLEKPLGKKHLGKGPLRACVAFAPDRDCVAVEMDGELHLHHLEIQG